MNLLLALLALTGGLDSTRVTGVVVSLAGGRPLAGVRISLGAAATITDTTGAFVLTVPAGARGLFGVEWAGRSGAAETAGIEAGPYEIVLDTEAERLQPLVGLEDWHLPGVWGMAGFFARRAFGYGQFYTQDDLRKDGFTNLRQVLAAQGVIESCVRTAGCGPVRYINGGVHFQYVWVDGVIQTGAGADDVPLDDVAGVEYYPPRGNPWPTWASTRWLHYTRYFLGEPLRGSMVIVWTRGYRAPVRR